MSWDEQTRVGKRKKYTRSIFELFWSTVTGKLDKIKVEISSKTAVGIVLSSEGYPGKYDLGMKISGLNSIKNNLIFHAGTRKQDHNIVVSGGRVLNVIGQDLTLDKAIKNSYDDIEKISFDNMYYRKDIGKKGLDYLAKEK